MPAPFIPPQSNKQILIYNYLYGDALDATGIRVDCTSGTNVAIDQTVGEFFYRFDYLDSSDAVIDSSPVYTYAGEDTIEYPYSGRQRAILHKAVMMSIGA